MKKRQAEKAAYEALSEKDKEALRLGREMMMLNECGVDGDKDEKKTLVECDAVDDGESDVENNSVKVVKYSKKRKRRIYLLVAAVAVLALAAGMTSIGGAPFVTGIMKKIHGEREMVQIDNEREGETDRVTTLSEEEETWQRIKDQLSIEPMRLGYLPEGTQFVTGEVDRVLDEAILFYDCKGKIIEYWIFTGYKNKSFGFDIEDNLKDEKKLNINGKIIIIRYYEIVDTNEEECVAQFEYNDVQYILRTNMEQEIEKIVENINF